MLLLYLCNIQIRYLHPIIILCHLLLYLLISSLSTLRFGPRWAKVPWTFSASQPPLNPSRPCQVSHSHDASLRGVWTINIPSRLFFVEQPNCFAFKDFIIHRKCQTTNSDDALTVFYLFSSPIFLLNSGSLLPPC